MTNDLLLDSQAFDNQDPDTQELDSQAFENQDFDDLTDEQSAPNLHTLTHTVLDSEVGIRLDKLASGVFAEFSRAVLQKMIETGELVVNGDTVKPKTAVKAGDVLTLTAKHSAHSEDLPENIPLDIVYEDDTLLVINKPAGLVVHPGAGNRTGTLVNALLYHYPAQAHLPRAGLVHRIDKDTTGLLVIAKTAPAQLDLIDQLKDKSVYRRYVCVVKGEHLTLASHATIDKPIARHPTARTKMAIRQNGKPAITHIAKITPLTDGICLAEVLLETGRTHQIRVHLSSIGCPLVGDTVYGSVGKKLADPSKQHAITAFPRQALHAQTLGLVHPVTGKKLEVSCPLPDDMITLIESLKD